MKVSTEINLTDFGFWSVAEEHKFTFKELNDLQYQLKELYPDGMTETQINELFWFEDRLLCGCLGLNYDEYLQR